jgi:hypothetical protein
MPLFLNDFNVVMGGIHVMFIIIIIIIIIIKIYIIRHMLKYTTCTPLFYPLIEWPHAMPCHPMTALKLLVKSGMGLFAPLPKYPPTACQFRLCQN